MDNLQDYVAKAICEAEIGGRLPGSLADTGERSLGHWRKLANAAIAALRAHEMRQLASMQSLMHADPNSVIFERLLRQ